jgi:hypothetical protein
MLSSSRSGSPDEHDVRQGGMVAVGPEYVQEGVVTFIATSYVDNSYDLGDGPWFTPFSILPTTTSIVDDVLPLLRLLRIPGLPLPPLLRCLVPAGGGLQLELLVGKA